jgi:hypothetical protein
MRFLRKTPLLLGSQSPDMPLGTTETCAVALSNFGTDAFISVLLQSWFLLAFIPTTPIWGGRKVGHYVNRDL